MNQFELKENEEILANFPNTIVKSSDNEFKLTILLTNQRIVLFKNIENELLMSYFLQYRFEDLEVVLIIPFIEIKELKYLDKKNIITFKNNNNIFNIYCEDFKSYRINFNE